MSESDHDAKSGNGVSPDDFDQQLDELSDGLPDVPTLPADFSRTDIYGAHD